MEIDGVQVYKRVDMYYNEDEIPGIVEWLLNCYDVPAEYEAADLKNELLFADHKHFDWCPFYYFTFDDDGYAIDFDWEDE